MGGGGGGKGDMMGRRQTGRYRRGETEGDRRGKRQKGVEGKNGRWGR